VLKKLKKIKKAIKKAVLAAQNDDFNKLPAKIGPRKPILARRY